MEKVEMLKKALIKNLISDPLVSFQIHCLNLVTSFSGTQVTLICSPIRTRRFEASEKSNNGSSHRIADDNGSLTTFPRIKVRPKKKFYH